MPTGPFYTQKTFWAMVSAILGGLGTTWAFVLDTHVMWKAAFVSLGVVSSALEVYFVASRVADEAKATRALVSGTGDGNAQPQPPQSNLGPRPL